MGFSKKHQVVDIGLETEGKKWVIAGIAVRGPMKPIRTKPKERDCGYESDESRLDNSDGEGIEDTGEVAVPAGPTEAPSCVNLPF